MVMAGLHDSQPFIKLILLCCNRQGNPLAVEQISLATRFFCSFIMQPRPTYHLRQYAAVKVKAGLPVTRPKFTMTMKKLAQGFEKPSHCDSGNHEFFIPPLMFIAFAERKYK
jgi:hypothetical protein